MAWRVPPSRRLRSLRRLGVRASRRLRLLAALAPARWVDDGSQGLRSPGTSCACDPGGLVTPSTPGGRCTSPPRAPPCRVSIACAVGSPCLMRARRRRCASSRTRCLLRRRACLPTGRSIATGALPAARFLPADRGPSLDSRACHAALRYRGSTLLAMDDPQSPGGCTSPVGQLAQLAWGRAGSGVRRAH